MSRAEQLRKLRRDAAQAHVVWWFSGLPSARDIAPIDRCLLSYWQPR